MSRFGKQLTVGAMAVALIVVLAGNSRAQDQTNYWWTGAAGNGIWEDSTNWLGTNNTVASAYPQVFPDSAVFTNTGTYSVSINSGDFISISNATFNCTTGSAATVTLTLNGSAALSEAVSGGVDGFTVAKGSNMTVTVYLAAGAATNSPGMDEGGNLDVGHDGNGTLIVTNGYVLTSNVITLGSGAGQGTLIISGPNTYWDAYQFAIGATNASYGNTLIVSNSANLTCSSTFRVGCSSTTDSSNNTLVVTDGGVITISGGTPFTVGNRSTLTGTLAYNNSIIVGNGGVINIPDHTIVVGNSAILESGIACSSCAASGTYATDNVFQVQAGGTVSNATYIAITVANTLQLYGGYFGGGEYSSGSYALGDITNYGVFEGWGVLAGSLNNGSNTFNNALGFIAVSNQVGQLVVSNSFTTASNTVLQIALGTNYYPIAVGLGQADTGTSLVTNNNFVLYGIINFIDSGGFAATNYTLFTYPPSLVVTQPANGSLINSNHFIVAAVIGTVPNPAYTYTISTNTPGEINLIVACTNCAPVLSTNSWMDGGSGKWEIASNNWSLGLAPSITDTVDQIVNATNKTVTIDATTVLSNSINGCLTISNLIVSAPLGSTNTLSLNNAGLTTPLQVLDSLTVGMRGVLQVTGSSLSAGSVTNTGVVAFNSGTLASGGTTVSNSQSFAVGDRTDAATFQLNGGLHTFANGMEIRNNATLTGCGAIAGNVLVDSGGVVLANCGGSLNFTGTVTNNATVLAVNGTTVNFYGPVVNNGVINATNGNAQFFGGVVSAGSILNSPGTNSWRDGNGKWENSNNWSLAVAPSTTDLADVIANGGDNTVTIDATTTGALSGATMTISNLTISGNTLFLNNAGTSVPLQVLGQFLMTNGASLLITNSAMQVSGGPLAQVPGGAINLLSGSFNIGANILTLGSVGNTSTFTVAGGTATMGALAVGVKSGNGTGMVLVTGGTLAVTNATGTGQLSLFAGTITLSNGATMVVDTYTNIGGTFTNLGGTFIINSQATVNQGTNTFSGGTTQIGSNLTVASAASSTGAVAVTGGSLIATNAATSIGVGSNSVASMVVSSNATVLTSVTSLGVGGNSTASLTVQGTATMRVLSNLTAGSGVGSTAAVSIVGGQLTATNGVIGIGNNGSTTNGFGYAQMTVSNSSVLANQILLGSSAGGHGDLTIQPNGVVSIVGSNPLLVPDGVTISGGELDIDNGQIQCGSGASFPGSLTMSSGTANCMVIYVGDSSAGTLTISGGQMTVSPLMDVGYASGSAGAVWMSGGTLTASVIILGDSGVGQLSLSNNGIIQVSSSFSVGASGTPGAAGTLTVAGGSLTVNAPVDVGAGSVWVNGGQLMATSLVIGYNNYGVGQLTISNGSVQTGSLVLTNNANSQFALVGGSLSSGGTVVTNTIPRFFIGNGINAATFTMTGGTHWFGNGLEITSNSTLTGCGTINGSVTVDPGGTVLANCGTLTFTGTVTDNGILRAENGAVLESYGTVVNNGIIDIMEGATSFHTTFNNNGTVVNASYFRVTGVTSQSGNVNLTWTTVGGRGYVVQTNAPAANGSYTNNFSDFSSTIEVPGQSLGTTNYLDVDGATNQPSRFYRIRLAP